MTQTFSITLQNFLNEIQRFEIIIFSTGVLVRSNTYKLILPKLVHMTNENVPLMRKDEFAPPSSITLPIVRSVVKVRNYYI